MTGAVILIDDERAMRVSIRQYLELAKLTVRDFEAADIALADLSPEFNGVVVADVKMPRLNGLDFQRHLAKIDADIPVVLITAHGDVTMAVEAMRAGAYDFIEKPFKPERLLDVLKRALEKRRLVLENRRLRNRLGGTELNARLLGNTAAMKQLRRTILDIAPTEASVLIIGETGTGKEVVAQCLHDFGKRRQGPFMAVNCAAVPDSMAESELFGHEKGAFTGAERCRIGKLEDASSGTLMLDELMAMPLDLQAKLLRVLEQREVVRLGSNKAIPIDIRLIATCNRDPQEAIRSGHFRDDLYYRVNTVEMRLPPLRERLEDLPLLFDFFANQATETHQRQAPPLSGRAHEALASHPWPGNLRELRNVAERYVLSTGPAESRLPLILQSTGKDAGPDGGLSSRLRTYERALIAEALRRHSGSKKEVMAELGLPRRTLNEKMARFGLGQKDHEKD